MITDRIGLHSVLLQLLTAVHVSIIQAKFQMECARDRRNVETSNSSCNMNS